MIVIMDLLIDFQGMLKRKWKEYLFFHTCHMSLRDEMFVTV